MNVKSLSGHPKNMFCKTNALWKNLMEMWDLVHGGIVNRNAVESVFENDT